MKKYLKKHIGKSFISNEGCKIKIVDGGSKKRYCNAIIYGGKKIYKKELTYDSIKKGNVKNLYLPSVFKIGYLGFGEYETTNSNNKNNKAYVTWHDMLRRCYYNDDNNKSYDDMKVCKSWLNFQNFAEWFYHNYKEFKDERTELDKDILSDKNNKIYSPENCCFIPQRLNLFMSYKKSNNTTGYTGVSIRKSDNKYIAHINDFISGTKMYLGSFNCPIEAHNVYKVEREKQCQIVKSVCVEQWNITDSKILNNII